MYRAFGVITTSIALVAGMGGASVAAGGDDNTVIVKKDRTNDVRTHDPNRKEEKARRFVKRSIDLKHVRYTVVRDVPIPKLRIVYKARNVFQANRRRDQQFRTDFASRYRYYFAWIKSQEKGPVEVWRMDRGGTFRVKCPRARMKLRPGPRKERVVQVLPLQCITKTTGTRLNYIRSSAEVLPFHHNWFVSDDRAPETGLVNLHGDR